MKRSALIVTLLVLTVLLVPGVTGASPRLLITEVLYNATGEDEGFEWVEIANVSDEPQSLDGVLLGDEETQGGGEGMLAFPAGSAIEPGQALIVAAAATGFQARHGLLPAFEIVDTDPSVPDMHPDLGRASGQFALANGGDEVLLLTSSGTVLDAVAYGEGAALMAPTVAVVPAGYSLSRVPAGCDSDQAGDWLPAPVPTPGEIMLEGRCRVPVAAGSGAADATTPIGIIQGGGEVAAGINQVVTVRGVVTGVLEDRNSAGVSYFTFFIQDVPGTEDGDPATSDGIAVFAGRVSPPVTLGDRVRVSGMVTEFYGLTEIDDDGLEIEVEAVDQALPEAVEITASLMAAPVALEALEGMRVRLSEDVTVVGPTFAGCSFAVLVEESESGRPLRRSAADVLQPVLPILHETDVTCGDFPMVQVGDLVQGLVGPLTYHFDVYKLVQPGHERLKVSSAGLVTPTELPRAGTGEFTIATFNLENLFDDLEEGGRETAPIVSQVELALRQRKIAAAIGGVLGCPTLLAVQEVENRALVDELARLAAPSCGFVYEVAHEESRDVRGIDVALLADPSRASVQSTRLEQVCTSIETEVTDHGAGCEAGQFPLFSRPPLNVSLRVDGRLLTVLVNHFKSKRGGEQETQAQRLGQAEHVRRIVAELLEADRLAPVLVVGDFNDYDGSPTITALTQDDNLRSLLATVPPDERYSYVFGGIAQLIDGVFATPALSDQVIDAAIVHINADFPVSLMLETGPEALVFRSSDHDVPVARLRWAAEEIELEEDVPESAPAPGATAEAPVPHDEGAAEAGVPAAPGAGTGPERSRPWHLVVLPVLTIGAVVWIWRRLRPRPG